MTSEPSRRTGDARQEAAEPRRDNYTRDRFRWLDQVAADPELPASAFKVAYAIATGLRRDSGTTTLASNDTTTDNIRELWIGVREIAAKIAMSFGTVAGMVRRLEERGHLQMDHGKPGRGHAHHYRLIGKDQPAEQLKDQPPEHYENQKDQPPEHFGKEKISRLHTNVQPAEQNPFVPLKEIPIEERVSRLDLGDEDSGRRSGSQNRTTEVDSDFEEWYRNFPKHVAKAAALKAYRAARKKATPAELLQGAMRYAAERQGKDQNFTAYPASWLNAGRWTDEASAPTGTTVDMDGNPVDYRPPPQNRQQRRSHLAEAMADIRLSLNEEDGI